MNSGQQRFQSFILGAVKVEDRENAKSLLNESFEKLNNQSFNQAYLQSFIERMLPLLKIEKVEEVQATLIEFGEKFNR